MCVLFSVIYFIILFSHFFIIIFFFCCHEPNGDVCLFFVFLFHIHKHEMCVYHSRDINNHSIELHKQLNLVAAAVQADPAALSALQGPPNTVHPAMVPVTSSGAVTGPPPPHSAAFFQSPHQSPYHFPPPMMTPIGTKQPSPPLHPQQQSHSPPQQVFHPSFLFPAGGAFNPAMFEAAAMVAAQQQQQVAQAQQAQQTALNNKMKTNTSSHQQLSAGTMTATQSLDHHHHHQHHNLTAVSHLMKRDHKYSPY